MKAFPGQDQRRSEECEPNEHGEPGGFVRDSPLVVVRGKGAPSGGEDEAQEDNDGIKEQHGLSKAPAGGKEGSNGEYENGPHRLLYGGRTQLGKEELRILRTYASRAMRASMQGPGLLGSGSGLLRRAAAPKIQDVPVKEFIHRPAVGAQKAQGFVKNDVGSGGATAAGCNFANGARAENVESQDEEDTNEPGRPTEVPTRGLELRSRLGIFGRLFHEQSLPGHSTEGKQRSVAATMDGCNVWFG